MCGQLTPLTHDFHRLLKNVKKLSNNQAKVLNFEDNLTEFCLEITPSDGYYKRGKFDFDISTTNYPQEHPKVICRTRIYHPNISEDDSGDVCLSLFDDWTEKNDLEDCVQGLLFLLYNPNLQDPLNTSFSADDEDQIESFEVDVRKSLEGKEVEGVQYERNIVDDELENEDATESKAPDCKSSDDGTEKEEPLLTEVASKDDETTHLQDNEVAKNDDLAENEPTRIEDNAKSNDLTENHELNTKNDTKIGLQNTRNQPVGEGTKIS